MFTDETFAQITHTQAFLAELVNDGFISWNEFYIALEYARGVAIGAI